MATTGDVWIITSLCAACCAHVMCHHELWPTSVSQPFSFLNSSLGLAGGKHYQKITNPIFRLILQNFAIPGYFPYILFYCPACRTSLIATRFWVVVICSIIKCLTVLEFSFILFDLCLFITIFNFILNYVPIVTFWIFTYHKIWILLIIFCFIWNYLFFNMFGSILECCELTGVSLLWPWLIKWK